MLSISLSIFINVHTFVQQTWSVLDSVSNFSIRQSTNGIYSVSIELWIRQCFAFHHANLCEICYWITISLEIVYDTICKVQRQPINTTRHFIENVYYIHIGALTFQEKYNSYLSRFSLSIYSYIIHLLWVAYIAFTKNNIRTSRFAAYRLNFQIENKISFIRPI